MYPNLRDEATGPTRLRTSVLHTRLMDAGAIWGQIMGYERAMYFTPDTGRPGLMNTRKYLEFIVLY